MENHKRRSLSCVEKDRMSNLPPHLIGLILERLPIQDAVRTSILSKSWRNKWTTMTVLVFDEQFSKQYATKRAFGHNGFIRIINHVLIFHNGPLSKFSLYIPRTHHDRFEDVYQMMLLISRKSVAELALTNSNGCYELPSYIYSCSNLKKLKLENYIIKPLLKFEVFSNLEHLHLKNIDFAANSGGALVTLPQLRKLFLLTCTNVYKFNIKASNLHTLVVYGCRGAMLLNLLDAPCLNTVCLYSLEPVKDFVQVERMNLTRLLSYLPIIEVLYMDGYLLKFLSADGIPKWLPRADYSLSNLRLYHSQLSDLDQLHGVLCLLRNSPNLERLLMRLQMVSKECHKYFNFSYVVQELDAKSSMHLIPFEEPQVMHCDVGPASNHLESPDCLDQTLNRLQTVEIMSFEGSRPTLLFIKVLLAHSPSLKKLTIHPCSTSDAHERLDIAMNVTRFPRASPKAELIFLNPKP